MLLWKTVNLLMLLYYIPNYYVSSKVTADSINKFNDRDAM